mmetsp:Transcript_24607/g.61753  ORF Transcript_24607/g.61753 Transcript_24607/m.61753 type:complete len:599 (-) Transcript_24607:276-2072(-)
MASIESEKERRRKEKQKQKAKETPAERQARREAKKAKKEAKRALNSTIAGYSNQNNPFNDANLTDRFVWKLKMEKMKEEGQHVSSSNMRDRQRREELAKELEKAKQRRLEREAEKEQIELERARLQREKDSLDYVEWERKEAAFHLHQAKLRADIRIREGRAKPIDILYMNLNMDGSEIELNEPYMIFVGLPLHQIEELRHDILMYQDLDTSEHRDFWQALLVVCDDELMEKRRQEAGIRNETVPTTHDGVHKAVGRDLQAIFKGKTLAQLEELQASITANLQDPTQALDVEYWEYLLKRLAVHKAKARLKEIHVALLSRKLSELEKKVVAEDEQTTVKQEPLDEDDEEPGGEKRKREDDDDESLDKRVKTEQGAESSEDDDECDSPDIIHFIEGDSTMDSNIPIVDAEQDRHEIEKKRREIMERETKKKEEEEAEQEKISMEEVMYVRELQVGMGEFDEQFSQEVALEGKTYTWNDRFRPRKPRYFNRVHTGYEWNKYNQTHFDHDNPPPKVVQGYKFNIFYPDLIEKHKTPQFFIEPTDNKDVVVLRFHAGPPYEDVAFRIVNREWEFGPRRGFKCVFDRGVFQLWFNFKRYRYRR